MAVVQRWMLLSCVLDIYIHILISGTLAIHHVYWISTFISQIHQQYIMCTGYLHSYPYLRYISNTSCVLDIYIYILDTLAVHHVYWISTFISISQVHQQYSMCTVIYIHIHISGTLAVQHCYLHSYPYLRYIGSKSCVLDIYIHIHILGTLAVHHVYWISTFDLMFTLAVHHVYWISSYLYFM